MDTSVRTEAGGDRPGPAGVHRLSSTRGAYAYAVAAVPGAEGRDPAAWILIDTGLPGRARAIAEELREIGAERVTDIVVTHADVDHVGNLAALLRITGARAWVSSLDRPYLLGERKRPGIKRWIGRIVRVKSPPADALADLQPGDRVGPLTAIACPGHTPGHLAFSGPDWLAVGDALTTRGGRVALTGRWLNADPAAALASARALLAGFRGWLLPAHGEPLYVADEVRL